jgi:hypothetical protein
MENKNISTPPQQLQFRDSEKPKEVVSLAFTKVPSGDQYSDTYKVVVPGYAYKLSKSVKEQRLLPVN